MTSKNLTAARYFPVLLILWPLTTTALGQSIEVHLKDGTARRGSPDQSTDESTLRLRCGEPEAYIVFGLDWDAVAEVRDEDRTWLPDRFGDFREYLAKRLADPAPSAARNSADKIVLSTTPSSRPHWEPPPTAAPSEPKHERVHFVEIDAVAANWNDDVTWDGVVLRVWPMNRRGEVVRAAGTISVTLVGERGRDATRGAGPRDTVPERLAHWSRFVRPADFGRDGVSLRLEYQNFQPERTDAAWHPDHWIEPRGEVHVRMAIPGHGVFVASTNTPIRLRRSSALGDRRFIQIGTRFFAPFEN